MAEHVYDRTRPRPTVQILYQYAIANVPDKSIVSMLVTYPPNGASPPHRHGGASVSAAVLSGSILNKMNDGPVQTIKTGESWYEAPGCHHKVCENLSKTESASFVATFVVDSEVLRAKGVDGLVETDPEYLDTNNH